jgi:ATP-dependent DNA helicase RecG
VVGTHALIYGGVQFGRLGVAVIDEQHRFGVEQRLALAAKGRQTHLLAMTATPIPRTLALSLYGDLDLSSIDEMPAISLVVERTDGGVDARRSAGRPVPPAGS